jgi:hypothetical protein
MSCSLEPQFHFLRRNTLKEPGRTLPPRPPTPYPCSVRPRLRPASPTPSARASPQTISRSGCPLRVSRSHAAPCPCSLPIVHFSYPWYSLAINKSSIPIDSSTFLCYTKSVAQNSPATLTILGHQPPATSALPHQPPRVNTPGAMSLWETPNRTVKRGAPQQCSPPPYT